MTGFAAMQHLTTGYEPQRHGNTSPDTSPSGLFRCADKTLYINCGNDKIFQRLFEQVLERPDIANDPVLRERAGRIAQRERLFAIIDDVLAAQPWSHWQPRFRAAAVPHGEVRSLGEALACDEARSRELVNRIPHPVLGWVPNIATPLRLARTPAVAPRAAPSVGEHTNEVLSQVLGHDPEQIAALARAGAFGPAA